MKIVTPGGGGPSQAAQAAIEAETNEDTYLPPDLIKNSPGVAKAWCRITSAGALESPSYNVASITDTGTGDRTINWDTDFSTNVYSFVCSVALSTSADKRFANDAFAVGSIRHRIFNDTPAVEDTETSVAAYGDQ